MGAYHALLGWAGGEVPAGARRAALAGRHSRRVAAHRMVAQLVPDGLRLAGARLCAHRQLVRRARAGRRAVRPRAAHAAAGRRAGHARCSATTRERIVGRRAVSSSIWVAAFALRGIEWTRAVRPARSPWRWCRARFRRTRSGSASNLDAILELYHDAHARGAWRRSHRLAGVGDPRPG